MTFRVADIRPLRLACVLVLIARAAWHLRLSLLLQSEYSDRKVADPEVAYQRNPRMLTWHGKQLHLVEADTAGAERLYRQALAVNPVFIPAWLGLAELKNDTALAIGQLVTAGLFHLPLIRRVQARVNARVSANPHIETGVTVRGKKAPTWVYEFAWPKPSTGLADHCAEIPFVFNCIDDENVAAIFGTAQPPRTLAANMHSDWVRFITTGQPGWSPWNGGNRGRIYGTDAAGSVRTMKPLRLEIALVKAMRNL